MITPNSDASVWLFDFDNTLAALEREVDWLAARRELEAALRAMGVAAKIFAEIPAGNLPLYAALHARWLGAGASLPLVVGGVAADRGPSDRPAAEAVLARASTIIEGYELAGVDRAAPTAGAIDLLTALAARGNAIVIVTSNSSRTVGRWLERNRATGLIRAIVGRDSGLALKPSPAMVGRALELCAAAPADAAFVGDSAADWGAACAAGVGFYGVAASASARDRLLAAGAGAIFAAPAALHIGLNLPAAAIDPDSDEAN
ncbi:MAG TPA: HAD hydrolase-like protein [Candidatus Binataceae bacterium]|nr:HAD hydrolase-like protein [Stellaceae bacterium]HVC45097.1 HAD hydrolase-like protein [Candidatus Binataceae bacterium]